MSRHTIVHVLAVYDGETEELVTLHRLERFDEAAFRDQFAAGAAIDPDLTETYSVGPDDVPVVQRMLATEVQFHFERYGYLIEAARDDSDA